MSKHAIRTDNVFPQTLPNGTPPPGLCGLAVIRGVVAVDRLLIDLYADGCELELVLVGLEPVGPMTHFDPAAGRPVLTPAARAARDWVAAAIESAVGNRHHVFLPRPRHVAGWLGSLRPGSRHAGMLFLAGDDTSLNARIAAAGVCPADDQCAYLSPAWNRPSSLPASATTHHAAA